MEKFIKYENLYIAILFFLIISVVFYFLPGNIKNNFYIGFVTFFVGCFIIYLYIRQKIDYKRDAAKIILQEIRRAEDIISDYKQSGSYQFAKKIIATNSWSENINLFVGDLDNDELDKISDLYSTGEYLDSLIKEISKISL